MSVVKSGIKSWKTTAAGFLAGGVAIAQQILALIDGDVATVFDLKLLLAGLGAIGIGWFSRDSNVTSKDAGAE